MPLSKRHALLATVASLCLGSVSQAAVILAQARANYAEFGPSATTAAFNGGTGLSDTFGTGRWNYYASDAANIGATANEALLFVTTPGNAGNVNYGGLGNGGDTYEMPGVGDTTLFDNGGSVGAGELALHPDNDSIGYYVVLRWKAGAGEAGLANIAGSLRKSSTNDDGITFDILYNGVSIYASGVFNSTTASLYSVNQVIAVNDTIDFVIGRNGNYFSDETRLSATITAVPEPMSLSLVGLASTSLLVRRRK